MEFELIRQLQQDVGLDPRVKVGIGDDCAVLPGHAGQDLLVTTDTLLDGVHFLVQEQELAQIARKSLGVSVSDVAAMGGKPTLAFLNLALPRSWKVEQARELFACFSRSAREFGVVIAGGDTTTWDAPLAISTTVHGEVPTGRALLRSGAKVGDAICVSGPLGGSIFGRQFAFMPRVRESLWLQQHCQVTSMMDLSDGLISDIHHLLSASQVAGEIDVDAIPVSEDVLQYHDDRPGWEHALTDGEDFELLFTMSSDDLHLIRNFSGCPVEVYQIGRIVRGQGCRLKDRQGRDICFQGTGYVHRLKTSETADETCL